MQVTEDVFRVDGVSGDNCYLLTRPGELVLLDSGLPGNAGRIVRFIRGLGRDPGELSWIVLTHSDPDHSGSVVELKQRTGAKVAIHAADAPSVVGGASLKEGPGVRGVVFRALLGLLRFRTFRPDLLLQEGDTLAGLRVFHTPGHTRGSISLLAEHGVLFSGDAVVTLRDEPTFPSHFWSLDFDEGLRSMHKLAGLDFDVLAPGHGPPVVGDAAGKLRRLLDKADRAA